MGILSVVALIFVFATPQERDQNRQAGADLSDTPTPGFFDEELPSHETLLRYTPPTISRVYSTEGKIVDEFAKKRRLFVPHEEIPDLVKHAFVSAEDNNTPDNDS